MFEDIIYYLVDNYKVASIAEFVEGISMSIYDWVVAFAFLFLAIEILDDLLTRRASKKRLLETLSSMATLIPLYFTEAFVFALAVYGYFSLYEFIPWKMDNDISTFLLVLFCADFVYYVEHFCLHKIRLLWAAHSVHHSSHMMNTATAFRFSVFDPIASAVFHLPLVLMGFNPIYIFAAEILVQAYQFWLHNEMVGKLGPIEWLFNTPSHHRVHHATNRKYIDKNYGGILIIWDRIFGTFQKEEELPKYGIYPAINTINPIKVQFHEVIRIFSDMKNSKSFSEALGYLYRTPGWLPEHRRKKPDNLN